ncbi:MAG: helix-turn-helix transcriptional regulator [Verrucomicrobia bacterium]|nr:helix-turn-helix transcriptional regulator [Verrucomicrobiota bacterium]
MSDWSDIGAELRKERESRGWTLRDVAHRTRIPAHTIEELENNDYRNFPSSTYAKSFLAQYSEHLEVDAIDWLEAFETGNALSNLDSYDYLKEHEEHLGEEVLPLKTSARPQAKAKAAPAPSPEYSGASNALQPLVVFVITATLLTAGAFGYLRLSEKIGKEESADDTIVTTPAYVEAPNIVHSRPAPTKPIAAQAATPPAVATAVVVDERSLTPTGGVAAPVKNDGTPITFDAPPPRAVIVEE